MSTQKTQLGIKAFLPAPSVSRAPAWAVDSGGGSTLSFAEALFQRSSLRFHCNTAAFRIHAAAIAGDSDQDENVEFAFASRGSAVNAETETGRRRERPAPAEEGGTVGGGNEENEEAEAFVADNDRERLKRRAERNFMQRVDGVSRSAAARFASDGVTKQLSCATDGGDSTLIMSVAPESIRLYRLDTSCGGLESPVAECLPFHGKRWGLGCLSASSMMMAMNSRSSVGIHVTSVDAFASRAFYRQEQDRDGALLARQQQHHRVDDNDSEAASPGSEEHFFPSFCAASERHANKRQNALTSIMWAGARDPHLVAAATSLTRAVLVWDLRANGKRGPVSEWSSHLPVAAAAAPLAMQQQPMGVASFAADSDGSYPVAMCTAAVAGGGAAPTAFVCVDSAFRVRMWDLRVATTSSSNSTSASNSSSSRTAISLTASLVGRPDAPSLLEALRPALRSSIAEGDTAAIGSCSSVAADPLQPRSVWLNSSGGFVGRVDLAQHCSAPSGAGGGSSAALSHALYEDESVRDAHTATLPAPRLAVLGGGGGEFASCTEALVACPRFSTRSVCVMVATDMLVDNGEAYAPGQQQPGQIRRRSAFARPIKPRRQRQFLLPQQQQPPNDDGPLVPVHCALVGRGIDEALVVEDQHRQLWYKRLAV